MSNEGSTKYICAGCGEPIKPGRAIYLPKEKRLIHDFPGANKPPPSCWLQAYDKDLRMLGWTKVTVRSDGKVSVDKPIDPW